MTVLECLEQALRELDAVNVAGGQNMKHLVTAMELVGISINTMKEYAEKKAKEENDAGTVDAE